LQIEQLIMICPKFLMACFLVEDISR
jgi:hypothetical protein